MAEYQSLRYFRGRVGLYHILRVLGIGAGDEVILQAFTCVAVPEAIMATGARPVWADIGVQALNIDASDVEAKLTPRTRAIVIQHTFGVPADMDAVLRLIGKTGVPLIEDCCHAFASTHRDRSLGSMGTAAFWSYEWGKPIIAGVGGEARFNNQELAARAAAEFGCEFRPPPFRKSAIVAVQYLMYSILYGPRRYWPVRNAFRALGKAGIAQSNYNPIGPDSGVAPDFHWQMCGFSSGQIAAARNRAVAFIPGRVDQASIYSDSITSFFARLPIVPEYSKAIYSRFPVFVEKKERLLNAAKSVSLEVADWYATPVHPLAGDDLNLVHYKVGSCPRAEAAARSLVSLPLHPKVTPDFQRDVAELFKRYASA